MNDLIEILNQPGSVICRSPSNTSLKLFHDPIDIISATSLDTVISTLMTMEKHLQRRRFSAGFISYEAAAAFDDANQTHPSKGFPYCWFAVYERPGIDVPNSMVDTSPSPFPVFKPEITKRKYLGDLNRLKRHIFDGDVYQVNHTFRSRGDAFDEPAKQFLALVQAHPVPYPAFVNAGDVIVLSNSPELFLERCGDHMRSLPMKGTAARALSSEADRQMTRELAKDPKNRAENVMIVDMVRHDFGKICEHGSIHVDPLFHVDTYPTVHQMISGVHGSLRSDVNITDVLRATFPPASITGAPKIRAMEIIRDTEVSPRGVYTGAIGCFAPNGDFLLNVAIRTLVLQGQNAELGIGSGVVADSDPSAEWDECVLKSRFTHNQRSEFNILETILWSRSSGFALLEEHIRRVRNSQRYFGRRWEPKRLKTILRRTQEELSVSDAEQARVRLLVKSNGDVVTEHVPINTVGWGKKPLQLFLSTRRVDSKNVFQYHKTTHRSLYDEEFAAAKSRGFDEVIFLNEHRQLAEGAISNVFIQRRDGQWVTPPIDAGLLPGVQRAKLIRELRAFEANVPLNDLKEARAITICNSVRGKGAVGHIQAQSPLWLAKPNPPTSQRA